MPNFQKTLNHPSKHRATCLSWLTLLLFLQWTPMCISIRAFIKPPYVVNLLVIFLQYLKPMWVKTVLFDFYGLIVLQYLACGKCWINICYMNEYIPALLIRHGSKCLKKEESLFSQVKYSPLLGLAGFRAACGRKGIHLTRYNSRGIDWGIAKYLYAFPNLQSQSQFWIIS